MYFEKDIIKEGNPLLRQKCSEVSLPLSSSDLEVLKNLYEYIIISANEDLVKQYNIRPGVGIAAPQVGVCKRMFAMNAPDIFDNNKPPYIYAVVNPKIIAKSKEMTYLPGGEGCLSVDRETNGITPRHYSITFKAAIYDFKTNKIKYLTKTLTGFPAIVFQHEYDHLDGIMFVDKLYDHLDDIEPLFETEKTEE